jgi:hypothetical protein
MDRREAKRRACRAAARQVWALIESDYLLNYAGDDRGRVEGALKDIACELEDRGGMTAAERRAEGLADRKRKETRS